MKPLPLTLSRTARARAISLIEGVLYLVIALAVIVGGIVFFEQANFSNQVTETSRAMTSLSSQVLAQVRDNPTTSGYDAAAETQILADEWMVKADMAPDNLLYEVDGVDFPLMRTPWGGPIDFVEAMAPYDGSYIPIIAARMNDLPPGACMRLGNKNVGGDSPVGVDVFAISVEDNGIVSDDFGWVQGTVLYGAGPGEATDFDALATACEEGQMDLVIYYEMNGIPDSPPEINISSTEFDGGAADDGEEETAPIDEGECTGAFGQPIPCLVVE